MSTKIMLVRYKKCIGGFEWRMIVERNQYCYREGVMPNNAGW